MQRRCFYALAAIGLIASSTAAFAAASDAYPNRPVRFIVPYPPGGANDILARIVGQKLGEQLGHQFVVDNRPGASGMVGMELVAHAAPDGYTILMVPAAFAVQPSLYKVPYDPVRDLAAVSLVAVIPNILLVNPQVPASSVKELIALAKAKPGQLNFGGAGVGGSVHLAGELFKSMAGIDIVHVPYKGGGPALTDLIGGHIQMLFPDALAGLPYAKSGKVKALGVTSPKRIAALPNVPAIAETLPGYDSSGWYGVLAPGKTPPQIVEKLSSEIAKALRSPDVAEKLSAQAAEPVGNSPKQFGDYIKSEMTKWAKVVKAAGIKAE